MANTTATNPNESTSTKSVADKASDAAEKASASVKKTADSAKESAKSLARDAEEAAKSSIDRVKDAVPSMEGVTQYVQDTTNVDLQKMADDATSFVRRNPGTSLAAAAGLGVLIGVAMSKRY